MQSNFYLALWISMIPWLKTHNALVLSEALDGILTDSYAFGLENTYHRILFFG